MSRRTSEASKAINQAWKTERELVLNGKGTRDWTQEQQQEIINKGKAYDENGKAFVGHHMKSAEKYPEYQGDPDNIQFLTKKEHLDAHRGNWQNPTNWYYNPVTYKFTDFGEGKFIPCTVIDLSYPIITISVDAEKTEIKQAEKAVTTEQGTSPPAKDSEKITSSESTVEKATCKESTSPKESKKASTPKPKIEPPNKPGVLSRVCKGAKSFWTGTVWPFIKENPLETARLIISVIKAGQVIKNSFSVDSSSERSGGIGTTGDITSSVDRSTDFCASNAEEIVGDIFTAEQDEDCEAISGSPKSPHSRRGYLGHRWKKNENGELELTETMISPAKIHPEQMDD